MPGSDRNLLLEATSPATREYILARVKPVDLPLRTLLYHPEEFPQYAYFLTSGMTSIVSIMEDGRAVESGMIGREGIVGGLQLLGPAVGPSQCIMQSDGAALRIAFADLARAYQTLPDLRNCILEFEQAQAFSLIQIAGCHRMHEAEERLSRWLLTVQDKTGNDLLELTQEFLGEMLGSRRTTITMAAGELQRRGVIDYSRGRVRILDRSGLENAACGCYPIVARLYNGLYSRSA
ncbi:Crp/Fnr family transcriptional regulator [Silvibacterium acidisoli]|uniref:Crp/Fnr family transcriptional regulator n=1 Tax=Acidobacteriaceae bacterium ZG23-2 TaxID=2883246 RepID=UPI00406C0BBC